MNRLLGSKASLRRGGLLALGAIIAGAVASIVSTGTVGAATDQPILHLSTGHSKGEICIIDPDGSDRRCLTENRRFDYDAVWSPDGTRIAFVQQTNNPRNPDIYVMDASGEGKRRLTHSSFDDEEPRWSPDGALIVWNRNGGDSPTGRLMVMRADGSEKRALAGRGRDDVDARWSPTGAKVLFASRDRCLGSNCASRQLDLHVVDADGTNERNLTQSDADEFHAKWSPDATRIAFVRALGGDDAEIFVMDADGSDVTQLTTVTGSSTLPEWSPDGSQIVFTHISDPDNFHTQVGIVDVASGRTELLTTDEIGGVDPVWSPDGSYIAFTGHRSFGRRSSYEIHTVRPDGSGLTRITRNAVDEAQLDWAP